MAKQKEAGGPLHQEQQGPASLQVGGPGAGYSLKDLGQPTQSQNAEEVMEWHHDHPKKHKQ